MYLAISLFILFASIHTNTVSGSSHHSYHVDPVHIPIGDLGPSGSQNVHVKGFSGNCTANIKGLLRMEGMELQYCDGQQWVQVAGHSAEENSETNPDRWRKMNFAPVCFGTKNQEFGKFSVHYVSGGKLSAVKLVHLYGYVTCDTRYVSYWSYWGCGDYYSGDKIAVVITTATNHVLLPESQFIVAQGAKWSKVPGYTSVSPELELSFFNPYSVQSGQKLRLWYGEDLMNVGEGDNGGRACVDIYAIYI
ncbi:uncharacterized protein [Montipora capricornis]|uniref:uncharacterized protein isoform X1 n=1 Tax=Montipora capricornis TaxID=246305 RepID=UPI0035F1B125